MRDAIRLVLLIMRHPTLLLPERRRSKKIREALREHVLGSSSYLQAGPIFIGKFSGSIENELLAVFRDDMLRVRTILKDQYLHERKDWEPVEASSEEIDVIEFRAPGQVIAARLDVMGIDTANVLACLNKHLSQPRGLLSFEEDIASDEERVELARANEWRISDGAERWVELLASSPEDPPWIWGLGIGSRSWLLDELRDLDVRYALRAVLLAFPDAEVVLDVTGLEKIGYLAESDRECLASKAAAAIGEAAGRHAPVVVLTEGRTDAEFLSAGLAILYPHLIDLIRFLDYERKPEPGVGALVRMVRAFAAAGIVNRVIAICDNDTAAADALRPIRSAKFPANIEVIRYPVLELAKSYPTLGPSDVGSAGRARSRADVNGLACSIELYLGTDVLTDPEGALCPVQWKSLISPLNMYQEEVVGKELIHRAFRAKYALALKTPEVIKEQDWTGLRLILDEICAVASRLSVTA